MTSEAFTTNAVIVYGGGGHGRGLIDLVQSQGRLHVVGVVDDALSAGTVVLGAKVLGNSEILPELRAAGVALALNAVGGIRDPNERLQVSRRLTAANFTCATIVHLSAFVEPSAILVAGCQILAHAYIGSQAHIGSNVIVNTGAVVSHDCVLEDHANIAPGVLLAGGVRVGPLSTLGMGVTVAPGTVVGEEARIGNGVTIKRDVPDGARLRAGSIWPP